MFGHHRRITATADFTGAADHNGLTTTEYEKGKTYEVPANMADVFVKGKLAKHAPGKPVPAPIEDGEIVDTVELHDEK